MCIRLPRAWLLDWRRPGEPEPRNRVRANHRGGCRPDLTRTRGRPLALQQNIRAARIGHVGWRETLPHVGPFRRPFGLDAIAPDRFAGQSSEAGVATCAAYVKARIPADRQPRMRVVCEIGDCFGCEA